jgi:hypothetical protein
MLAPNDIRNALPPWVTLEWLAVNQCWALLTNNSVRCLGTLERCADYMRDRWDIRVGGK